jgi:tetratricopeptide (TPR) repeat protein
MGVAATDSSIGVSLNRSSALRQAETALALGNTQLAIDRVERIIGEDPTHLPAFELLAKALWQVGDLPRLVVVLQGMIRMNPYEPGYFALLGAAEQSLGRIGAAITPLARSLELDPKDTNVAAMLGSLRAYQTTLIDQLLAEDQTFRREYADDPVEACRARGFEIDPPVVSVAIASEAQFTFLAARPS